VIPNPKRADIATPTVLTFEKDTAIAA